MISGIQLFIPESFSLEIVLDYICIRYIFYMLGFIISLPPIYYLSGIYTKDKAEWKPDLLATNQKNFM